MELFRALGAMVESPSSALRPLAESLELGELPVVDEYTELFGMQLVPYASIYLSSDGRIGGEARDRIAGFWRAVAIEPPREPDQITVLLSGYAGLVEEKLAAGSDAARDALTHQRRAFLHEHLLSWLPIYLFGIERHATPFYCRWAGLLTEALTREAVALQAPTADNMHRRAVAMFPAPDCDPPELLDALLAPMRSGLILTRRELSRGARELGIAARIGERRFMLEAMFAQSSRLLTEWLIGYCDTLISEYKAPDEPRRSWLAPWARRLEATRRSLADSLPGRDTVRPTSDPEDE